MAAISPLRPAEVRFGLTTVTPDDCDDVCQRVLEDVRFVMAMGVAEPSPMRPLLRCMCALVFIAVVNAMHDRLHHD